MRESTASEPQPTTERPKDSPARRYWRANIKLILSLLAVWAAVSYGCGMIFIEQLNQFSIGNLPLGFWFAQQGSIYVFVVLIFIYAFAMDRLDRKHGLSEKQAKSKKTEPAKQEQG